MRMDRLTGKRYEPLLLSGKIEVSQLVPATVAVTLTEPKPRRYGATSSRMLPRQPFMISWRSFMYSSMAILPSLNCRSSSASLRAR